MKSKILIAEDDPVTQRTLKATLDRWDYQVVPACDGREAWAILQKEDAPQLAILNGRMPGMDGIEICREVRRCAQKPYTYMLLLTAKDRKQDLVEGMEAGADDYLTKPFNPAELRMRLRAGQQILGMQRELGMAREVLRLQATRDTLTGLWNQRAILDLLRKELTRARRENGCVGVAMAALDHWQRIQDTYGRPTGEAVLREIGQRLRRSMRPYDGVGRYGEETFLLITPGCPYSSMLRVAERLRANVGSKGMPLSGHVLSVTVSIGVFSSSAAPQADVDQLLSVTAAALQRAKNNGRNRVELATPADVTGSAVPQ